MFIYYLTNSLPHTGDYPPKKPILSTSGGANEINVSWVDPPKQLGPIEHYELVMNGQVIYTGREQSYRVSNLEPLAEYTFNVRSHSLLLFSFFSFQSCRRSWNPEISRGPLQEMYFLKPVLQVRVVTADKYVIESEPARKKAGAKGNVLTSSSRRPSRTPSAAGNRPNTTLF